MNFIKRNIPNAITCGNLLCGCLAIVKAFEGDLVWAAYLVGVAAVLDFFDGFAARMLKVSSPIGKDLDSLADMVTFGVVPGVVMFKMITLSPLLNILAIGLEVPDFAAIATERSTYLPSYLAFLIPIFSAIRLAKFNNDTRQTDSFIGVPTPANAILICSIPLVVNTNPSLLVCFRDFSIDQFVFNPFFLPSVAVVMSFLLVAELPLIALKFKHFKWKGNEIRFIFLLGALILLATLQLVGIPLVIVFYILISIVNNLLKKKKNV